MLDNFFNIKKPLSRLGFWTAISLIVLSVSAFAIMLGIFAPPRSWFDIVLTLLMSIFFVVAIAKRVEGLKWDRRLLLIPILVTIYLVIISVQRINFYASFNELSYFLGEENAQEAILEKDERLLIWRNVFESVLWVIILIVGIMTNQQDLERVARERKNKKVGRIEGALIRFSDNLENFVDRVRKKLPQVRVKKKK